MKRIGGVVVGFMLVAALVVALASPALAAYKAEYKMSVRTTQTSPWGAGAQKFADTVREKSGGLINIKVYFNGALFADDQAKEFMLTKQGKWRIGPCTTRSHGLGYLCRAIWHAWWPSVYWACYKVG